MNDLVPTIAELLSRWEHEKPESLAVLLPQPHGVREITWREFAADVRRVAMAWHIATRGDLPRSQAVR